MKFAVITENDVSPWDDKTGQLYHFPKRYAKLLPSGTKVIYYKGKLKQAKFADQRLTKEPHYFAVAEIGTVKPDPESKKGDLYADIVNYRPFDEAILAKKDGDYLEDIPESKRSNYWRDGVREITIAVYYRILGQVPVPDNMTYGFEEDDTQSSYTASMEGEQTYRTVSTYERDPKLRAQAIEFHGRVCKACGFDFGSFYGSYAEGFIEVHHIEPLSMRGGPIEIDPRKDLVPLCSNCHSVVHRKRDQALSIEQLKEMISQSA
ncbi:HNH endonuclease [Pseudovibrio sp. Ad37]|uniref:HNH endonuclease n=1 Tax=Pseudovibrio sp. Ad37 TaxID=989422 RepID=UPI0007AEC9F8|nr:HNH endonuclease [Pseudovibrio sp. Ad37]KZL17544.1 HNH endonuclease [Pseudovibrio sp. Ad37]